MSRLSDERIDEFLEAVLNAGGSSLRYYTLPKSIPAMREAARAIEREAYKAGQEAMRERAALEAEKEFTYPAGYQGQWEGYGAIRTVRHGKESAAAIRNLEIEEPK